MLILCIGDLHPTSVSRPSSAFQRAAEAWQDPVHLVLWQLVQQRALPAPSLLHANALIVVFHYYMAFPFTPCTRVRSLTHCLQVRIASTQYSQRSALTGHPHNSLIACRSRTLPPARHTCGRAVDVTPSGCRWVSPILTYNLAS